MKDSKNRNRQLPVIGWREWVVLPEFGIRRIKAKVDTGARSSAIHAIHVKEFERNGQLWVRFQVHPMQRSTKVVNTAEAIVIDRRAIRSSSGKATIRPVIKTTVKILGVEFDVELTLANRDEMGFRMLLGREAFRNRFLIDPGNSYFGGKPKRKKKSTKKKVKKKTKKKTP